MKYQWSNKKHGWKSEWNFGTVIYILHNCMVFDHEGNKTIILKNYAVFG